MIGTGCVLFKIDSDELPDDTQITYQDGKISLQDSIGNSAKFETNELTILHSKTIVVNESAYIITAPNVRQLAGKRYYVDNGILQSQDIEPDDDDVNDDNNEADIPHSTDDLSDDDFEGRCDGKTCNCDGDGCDFKANDTDSDESD